MCVWVDCEGYDKTNMKEKKNKHKKWKWIFESMKWIAKLRKHNKRKKNILLCLSGASG